MAKEKRLPNFIGLGVQKGGTSWLHKQLVAHPQVFIPEIRKEIHYFDEYYDRGVDWYEKWFLDANNNYKPVGEITPEYIYFEEVLPRVKETLLGAKFIVMLRDPVRRAYSHYQMNFQSGDGQKYKDFDDFMTHHPHAFKRGLYADQLKRWFKNFDKNNFLILISEEIFSNKDGIKQSFLQIGNFLDIDSKLFDMKLAQTRVGKARHAPKYKKLATFSQNVRLWLRDHDLDHVALFLKKLGLTRQIFGKASIQIPPLSDADYQKWSEEYANDKKALEALLGRDFPDWK